MTQAIEMGSDMGFSILTGTVKWTFKQCLVQTNGQWKLTDGSVASVDHPHSWVHTLGTVVGGLARNGFVILGIGEETSADEESEPGSWEHFKRITVPYLRVWTRLVPEAFCLPPM